MESEKGTSVRRVFEQIRPLLLAWPQRRQSLSLSYRIIGCNWSLWPLNLNQKVVSRFNEEGWSKWSEDEKESKELLLPFLCFVLDSVTWLRGSSARAGNRYRGGSKRLLFPAKDYKHLVVREQEIGQFKWPSKVGAWKSPAAHEKRTKTRCA